MGITVSHLTKMYGTQRAVDDISFEVKTGEILGFLGPNGAGKSTTMKVMTCYLNPTAGTVNLDQFNIHDHPMEVRRRIGYLPEDNPLYEDMNIVDYLTFTARLQEMPESEIRPRIREMIDICGLGPERHKDIGELSKGFQQRVGLAQALIHDPEVLILDEPTTGLDPNQIAEIRSLIRKIGQEKTIMLSSHILKEVEATCDRILIINEGELVADGSTDELRRMSDAADRLYVEIKSDDEDQVGEALEQLDTVTDVQSAENGLGWTLQAGADGDPREEVFRMCVEKDWVLLQMTTQESSLEDVFRRLTTAEKGEAIIGETGS